MNTRTPGAGFAFTLAIIITADFTGSARAADPVDYRRDIEPLLARACVKCHGPEQHRGGLRLDSPAHIRAGGNSGLVLVPGKSAESVLIQALTGSEDVPQMPPKGKRLDPTEIALLRRWVDQGAKAPENDPSSSARPSAARSTHWAFQPPAIHPPPPVRGVTWVRTPIDSFVLAGLEAKGLTPAPEADKITLLRRVSLDLIGLPPTPAEVDAFLADTRPDAYERQVARLLASPHYGERWGRHWLDQARYADSNGFNIDAPRSIWKYRDWVIDALNRDLPFDRFTVDQVAGDMLPDPTTDQLIATGFHRNTLKNEEGGIDLEQFRVESVVDRVNTTGAVFLGLTLGCAQCHDHKFDPISQREYYQLFAFFNSADEPALEVPTPEQVQNRSRQRSQIAAQRRRLAPLEGVTQEQIDAWEAGLTPAQLMGIPAFVRAVLDLAPRARTDAQKRTLFEAFTHLDHVRHVVGGLGSPTPLLPLAHLVTEQTRRRGELTIDRLRQRESVVLTTMIMRERKTPRESYIHLGGDFLRKGVRVTPAVPAVMHPLTKNGPPTRLDLARWLADPANPLTPRVVVNRMWQVYFGVGLVETDNDFGTQGSRPTHPELLDWLAREFVARGWGMKSMHRLIVTSATYRQASTARPELAVIDPRNRLLGRQVRVRLEAEAVRDVFLEASGLLRRKIGGPGVFPPQPDGVFRFTQIQREWTPNTDDDRYRRGMYTYFWRSAPYPTLTVFDAPDSTTTCTRRNRSNTPLQALTLLNDQAFVEMAQALAVRVLREAASDDAGRLRYAFRLCVARPPKSVEERRLKDLLDRSLAGFANDYSNARKLRAVDTPAGVPEQTLAAWTTVARVLLNLDEVITRE